jgi:hypothetical protein
MQQKIKTHASSGFTTAHSEADNISREFNIADYTFVSTKLAEQYPHLMESAVVMSYKTSLPGDHIRAWAEDFAKRQVFVDASSLTVKASRDNLSIRVFLVVYIFGLIKTLVLMPFDVQKSILKFIQPFVFGGLVLLLHTIISSPIILSATSISLFLIVCLVVYFNRKDIMERIGLNRAQHRVSVAATAADQHNANKGLRDLEVSNIPEEKQRDNDDIRPSSVPLQEDEEETVNSYLVQSNNNIPSLLHSTQSQKDGQRTSEQDYLSDIDRNQSKDQLDEFWLAVNETYPIAEYGGHETFSEMTNTNSDFSMSSIVSSASSSSNVTDI